MILINNVLIYNNREIAQQLSLKKCEGLYKASLTQFYKFYILSGVSSN